MKLTVGFDPGAEWNTFTILAVNGMVHSTYGSLEDLMEGIKNAYREYVDEAITKAEQRHVNVLEEMTDLIKLKERLK